MCYPRSFKRKSLLFMVFVLMALLSATPVFAATTLQSGLAPLSMDPKVFTPQDVDGPYVEATNSFHDGNPTYYLVTQDPNRAGITSVTFQGQTYPIAQVLVGTNLTNMKVGGETNGFVHPFSPGNRTFFFDDGTYHLSEHASYTHFSGENKSYVGLNRAGGEPAVTITREPYPANSTATIRGMIERYNIMHKNVYFENIIFDGQNNELLPLGGSGGIGKNRGEYMFFLTGGADGYATDGFVMRGCIIQNVGADATTQPGGWLSPHLVRKNVAFNFYKTFGQQNVEDVIIRNVKTKQGFGIVSFNESANAYLRNLTVVGDNAHPQSRSIKVERMGGNPSVVPIEQNNVTFAGDIKLPSDAAHNHIYVQDYRYDFVRVPLDFNYAKWRTVNGGTYSESFDIYKDYPGVSDSLYAGTDWAVHDLKDDYWIVEADHATLTIEQQLANIRTVMNYAGNKAPSANIKLLAKGDIPSFTVPDFGDKAVNIVAVNELADRYTSTDLVPFVSGGTITLQPNNQVKLYNFDFASKASYTMHEATNGITALTALTDPNEANPPAGYPVYASYAPTTAVAPKVTHSNNASFVNCQFVVLAASLEGAAEQSVNIGSTLDLASVIGSGYTEFPPALGGEQAAAKVDDPSIAYYSSDPSVATVDANGKVTGIKAGTVTITAKALDANNNGEIEKPWRTITVTVLDPGRDITAKLTWVNGSEVVKPTVQFQLMRLDQNGQPTIPATDVNGNPVPIRTLPAGTEEVVFHDIPIIDERGNAITYAIVETGLDGTPWINSSAVGNGSGTAEQKITPADVPEGSVLIIHVINTYQSGQTEVTVNKNWTNGGPIPKPVIEIQLYRRVEGAANEAVEMIRLPHGTTSHTWKLDLTDAQGRPYFYSAVELNPPSDYTTIVSEDGLTIYNRFNDPVIPVTPVFPIADRGAHVVYIIGYPDGSVKP